MNRIKALKPSLREKKRYLAFEIISKAKIKGFSVIRDTIADCLTGFLGTRESSLAGMIILKERYNQDKQRGIIKISHKYVDKLRASFCFIEKIGGQKVIVRSLGTSGILKKAHEKYILEQK